MKIIIINLNISAEVGCSTNDKVNMLVNLNKMLKRVIRLLLVLIKWKLTP
jgi:hypothetical protein